MSPAIALRQAQFLGYRPKAIVVLTERTRSFIGACLRKGGIGAITHIRAMGAMGVKGTRGVKGL